MKDHAKPTVFDTFALNYDADLEKGISVSGEDKNYFASGRIKILAKRLKEMSLSPSKIMDFGCGTGSAIPFLRYHFPKALIVGVEISKKSIKIAEELHKSHGAQFTLLENLVADSSFDLVFCNGVFHHISIVDRGVSIQIVRDALRPEGCFAFWENNPWNPGTRIVMSRIPFDRDAEPISPLEAKKLLIQGKFRVFGTDFCFYFPRILRAMRWIEPFLIRVPLGAQYQILCQK